MTTHACRICASTELDLPWEALAGENPGPAVLAIGMVRHSTTGLNGLGWAMHDDVGVPRCVTCLRVVPSDRLTGNSFGYRDIMKMSIHVGPVVTGYELLCCGATE